MPAHRAVRLEEVSGEMSDQIVGQGKYTYVIDKTWGRRAGGVEAFGVAQGVAGDSRDQVYVFQRSPRAEMLVFDRDGKLLTTWGEGRFTSPHGIWVSPEDEIYITDTGSHTVSKWTTDGSLLRTWGTPGTPGQPDLPFNRPTKAVVTPDGEMYVSDGYGQQRVHRYDRSGDLIQSWGSKGAGPGQFTLPHDVWVDERDRVLVCDRESFRVQVFDRDGNYVEEWANLPKKPMQIFIRDGVLYMCHSYADISIRTLDGELITGWAWESTVAEAREKSPHSLWVDSRGDIYVGEVVGENGFQKFARV
jgi:sugar lactone lactonase YvrE